MNRFGRLFWTGLLLSLTPALPALASAKKETASYLEKLEEAAKANRYVLEFDGQIFSGPAMEKLVDEGSKAQFFLIGEEHGIAENPKLAAALFRHLKPAGYSKVAIEVSPFMAARMDRILHEQGIDGLRELFAEPGGEPTFFGMREEAEFIANVRTMSDSKAPVLWGADYEVASERQLLTALEQMGKPKDAAAKLQELREASNAAWKKYEETRGPQFIFSFSGDPKMVEAVKASWPDRSDETSRMLDTLQQTLEINQLFVGRQILRSNEQRSNLIRSNFLRHWKAEKANDRAPRVMAKFGASHLVRGRNFTEVFDLGPLLHNIAELEGSNAFSILVLPGRASSTAVFNPSSFSYGPAPAKDGYAKTARPLYEAAFPGKFTLIDLRALRPIVGSSRLSVPANLMKTIHGFDMVLIMSGSTPSSELEHPAQR